MATPAFRLEGDLKAAVMLRGRATNLLYHTRSFVETSGSSVHRIRRKYDEGDIEVLTIEGQEYVTIFGGGRGGARRKMFEPLRFQALSGVIQGDALLPSGQFGPAYRPTTDAYVNVLGSPDEYSPVEFRQAGDLFNQKRDSPEIRSQGCSYSGLLAVMLDLLAGFRNIDITGDVLAKPKDGLFVTPNFRSSNDCTHGIVKFGDTPWLVEISFERGVVAMRLPMLSVTATNPEDYDNGEALKIQKCDATEECERLFGGIPSGQGFPTTPVAFAKAVADGDVKVLLDPEALVDYYGTTGAAKNFGWMGFGDETGPIGWSFNASGTEAHNTNGRRVIDPGGQSSDLFAQHWKITFSGGDDSLSATLSLVERGLFIQRAGTGTGGIFSVSVTPGGPVSIVGDRPRRGESGEDLDDPTSVTLFVMHHGDRLVRCRYESWESGGGVTGGGSVTEPGPIFTRGANSRVYVDGADVVAPMDASYSIAGGGIPENFEGGNTVDIAPVSDIGFCAAIWWDPGARDAVAVQGSANFAGRGYLLLANGLPDSEAAVRTVAPIGTSASSQTFNVIAPRARFVRTQPPSPEFFEPFVISGPFASNNFTQIGGIDPPGINRLGFWTPRGAYGSPNNQRVRIAYSACGPNAQLFCSGSNFVVPPVNLGQQSPATRAFYGINVVGNLMPVGEQLSLFGEYSFLGFI